MFDCVYPYGHGFITATSWKLDGKVSQPCARLIVTAISSSALASEGDILVDPVCSRRLASRWQAKLDVHPAAGHDLPLLAPDWIIEKVRGFLSEPEKPAATHEPGGVWR